MISTLIDGSTLISYSSRFSLTGMTGTFYPAVYQGVSWLGAVVNGPASTQLASDAPLSQALDPWDVPLAQQTGPIAYAPMQRLPGPKITAVMHTAKWPTSEWSVAKSKMTPNMKQLQTMTQGISWTFSQRMNTEEPASKPNDLDKFLNRWRD
jgi:hypothetical protein